MPIDLNEFPKHPLPHVPQPRQPEHPQVQPPMVFVYEKQRWEYKVVTKVGDESDLSEVELNTLGGNGWELVGVVSAAGKVQFYLKRART